MTFLSELSPHEIIVGMSIICVLVLIAYEVIKLLLEHRKDDDEDTTE